jgi:hypothetical protein
MRSRSTHPLGNLLFAASLALGLLAYLFTGAQPAWTDDTDLFREAGSNPYVFILLDVSGSMNQSVPCDPNNPDQAGCAYTCPPGICLPRLLGDDPSSKIYGAKQAIYEIMRDVRDLNFGFATFDQDGLKANRKHFWYQVAPVQPAGLIPLGSTGQFYPAAGQEDIFGQTWVCNYFGRDSGGVHEIGLAAVGCDRTTPSDLDDHWEWERVRRWPKLDENGLLDTIFYVRTGGQTFRVKYAEPAATAVPIGAAQITVSVEVRECTVASNATCSDGPLQGGGAKNILFDRTGDMLYWEPGEGIRRQPQECTNPISPFNGTCPPSSVLAFFGSIFGGPPAEPNRPRQFSSSGGTAWDGNNVTGDSDSGDGFTGGSVTQNLRQDTINDPFSRGNAYSIGDVIPWDWRPESKRQRERIALRMAPNLIGQANPLAPAIAPDFRISSYFEDHPPSIGAPTTGSFLRLDDPAKRPLIADGGTPTGGAMTSFRSWFINWVAVAGGTGANNDPDFACRKFYLLVVTDGLASDGTTACARAAAIYNLTGPAPASTPLKVKTFAVGFGFDDAFVPGRANVLDCIAQFGRTGTGDEDGDGLPDGPGVLLPNDKDELVRSLTEIFKFIRADSRSFASAAVPSVQVESQDKIYLTSFNPVSGGSFWPGRVDAYLKPVPTVTTPDNRRIANREKACAASDTSNCQVWDAGSRMLPQAPTTAELAGSTPRYRIGNAEDERRVYYTRDLGAIPLERKPFLPPADAGDFDDLRMAMGIPAGGTAAVQVTSVIKDTLVKKAATVINPISGNPESVTFVLGDVFHSDPLIVGSPNRFRYFASNLEAATPTEVCAPGTKGYRCFVQKHELRRKILLLGSNDGQIHAFDAGLPHRVTVNGETQVVYDNGTGKELFSYIPRPHLAALKRMTDGDGHELTVDGSPLVDDVFIDPVSGPADPVNASQREWRTVAITGMREGGRVYSALDITQPDRIVGGLPEALNGASTLCPTGSGNCPYVPSCIDGSAECGPVPFPSALWEFTDTWDEDNNGAPDLGDTWSKPNTGRIRVREAGNEVVKYVAIFGGGMDAEFKRNQFPPVSGPSIDPLTGDALTPSGNFLYIVDIETGETIYKRRLDGIDGLPASVPSEPAAVDTDQDGLLDRIYIGTTAGYLFKVNIGSLQDLVTTTVFDYLPDPLSPVPHVVKRVTSAAWDPLPIFNTGQRPIYFPPSVIFVGSLSRYALAFGTGDREDLWDDPFVPPDNTTRQEGRFYLILDENFSTTTAGLPLTETDFTMIDADIAVSANLAEDTNFLTNPPAGERAGWFMRLDEDERVITRGFALSGITTFSSYVPDVRRVGTAICGQTGFSRLYVVFTTNANSLLRVSGNDSRYREVQDLVTNPYVEQSATKNPPPPGEGGGDVGGENPCADQDSVRRLLMRQMPANCRFANYTTNLMTIRSDTGQECVAPVPICVIEKNWKEF